MKKQSKKSSKISIKSISNVKDLDTSLDILEHGIIHEHFKNYVPEVFDEYYKKIVDEKHKQLKLF